MGKWHHPFGSILSSSSSFHGSGSVCTVMHDKDNISHQFQRLLPPEDVFRELTPRHTTREEEERGKASKRSRPSIVFLIIIVTVLVLRCARRRQQSSHQQRVHSLSHEKRTGVCESHQMRITVPPVDVIVVAVDVVVSCGARWNMHLGNTG